MPEVIFNGPDGRLEGRYHHGPRPGAPAGRRLSASVDTAKKMQMDRFALAGRRPPASTGGAA
jgi:hypothetical protein